MRRFSANNESFYQLGKSELPEFIFEQKLIRLLPPIFEELHVIPFKLPVSSKDFGTASGDLALIDVQYRFWIIVEVELVSHSLFSHVLPQVKALKYAYYSGDVADYIYRQSNVFELEKLKLMLKGESPRVVVIANDYIEEWHRRLHQERVDLLVGSIFESKHGHEALELIGDLPAMDRRVVSRVEFVPTLPTVIRLSSPASIIQDARSDLYIVFDDQISVWSHLETKDEVWLISRTSNPLNRHRKYSIVINDFGELEFEVEEDLGD